MWSRIRKFGRFPKQLKNIEPDNEAQRQENELKRFLEAARSKGVPDVVWTEMKNYGASQPVDATQLLMDDVKEFVDKSGRMPNRIEKKRQGTSEDKAEDNLAQRLAKAIKRDALSAAQKDDLKEIQNAAASSGAPQPTGQTQLLSEVRELGHYPRESKSNPTECRLALRLRRAIKRGSLAPAELTELEGMRERAVHPNDLARSAQLIEEAEQPPNPMEGFADVAENRLEQDLLILASGQRTRALLRRLKRYRDFIADPAAAKTDFCLKYKDRIKKVADTPRGPATYVPGCEITGDELRSFSDRPIISGPLVCQLCDSDFTTEKDFARHVDSAHAGLCEYRKRVLYLMAEAGPKPLTGQEKRLIVQNFARFQQYCRPCTGGNFFADAEEVPRAEAACAVCARKDWLEHRYKLSLFGDPPLAAVTQRGAQEDGDADGDGLADAAVAQRGAQEDDKTRRTLVKHKGIYYVQSAEKVHEFMNVERYAKRWPMIPSTELHASSVQHPSHPEWRWLLHTRRVPVVPHADVAQLGVALASTDEPACAGIGDPDGLVWSCWDCLQDLCARKPRIPLDALVNDNWVGREKPNVSKATVATKTLLSHGRLCMKQVRLGRSDPSTQQTGVSGNTIFFAQPTADIPSMELPPPTDALQNSFNIILTRKLDDLRYAQWATIEREPYMELARQRKAECPAFLHTVLKEDEAATRLPERGVPEHLLNCRQLVDGADKAPVHLSGPAARAPEHGHKDEAGEGSESSGHETADDAEDGAAQPDLGYVYENVAESTVAVDPVHDVQPVRMMQALQAKIGALSTHAKNIAQNEKKALIVDNDGVSQPVVDEGGRHSMTSLVLDVQQVARSLKDSDLAALEATQTGEDARRTVFPQALAVPTQKPLDSFDARTWPLCFVEWWYGDGAPNLERERPMLFEQVAQRVINIEELEYTLPSDVETYVASKQSRFNTPEIVAVLGDVVRRLRLLKGTRAAVGRKGFSGDLEILANASADDFMEASSIANPKESIVTAVSRPDMPTKVKTALRTLLLSTSDVPGTEGRKTALRYDGHGNNLLFGPPSFFNTPNFADTYHPLMVLLHEGPGKRSHLSISGASQPADSTLSSGGASQPADSTLSSGGASQPAYSTAVPHIARAEPTMPSSETMHQITAKDPRAQAKFFILMTELHYRFNIGLERLRIGRLTLAHPSKPVHDEVASSLQPSLTPGTTDVQAPFEAQGRGFEHGHGKGHSMVGATMQWLRKAVTTGLTAAADTFRTALLAMAATVQYESAREPAKQMGVHDLPPEPFTAKQQRQTRMDGGEDEDGTLREFVELGPPVVQPHLQREALRAAAQNRAPLTGCTAYRQLPLTGAFQSSFPSYRQRFSFASLGSAPQPATYSSASLGSATQPASSEPPYRSDAELFSLDEDGKVRAIIRPDGKDADEGDLARDADAWAAHFGWDAFNNHCTNHEHSCTETCVKYVKKKLEAKQSLRSNKVPSCRFWYFRVKKINNKSVRRRGKPLVKEPYVEASDDRNQEFRCQLKREQPLRSTSNDVCQVTARCNVDFQFLSCAPPEAPAANDGQNDAPQLVPRPVDDGQNDAPQLVPRPVRSKRLYKKTKPHANLLKRRPCRPPAPASLQWLYGVDLTKVEQKSLHMFSAAFRKAYQMDFYITKYQGKMMESLTPLFQTMTSGIHRLEQQEKEEADAAQQALAGSDAQQANRKKPRTQEEVKARARRLTVRLASMANRCYWLSTTEVVTHILTGGDALQTHHNQRVFTRQLQWSMQHCKRRLNGERPPDDISQNEVAVQTVQVKLSMELDSADGVPQPIDEAEDDVEVEEMSVFTTSTNVSDDYAHRGSQLQSMPYYVYRMYVKRVPRKGRAAWPQHPHLFALEPHYALASTYLQEVCLTQVSVPTIDGFHCPTWEQNPEDNSCLKALLFTPWQCLHPMTCGSCDNFAHMLSNNTTGRVLCRGAPQPSSASGSAASSATLGAAQPACASFYKFSFQRAWRLRCSEIHVLAARADARRHASQKKLVLADTTRFSTIKEPAGDIQQGDNLRVLLERHTCRLLQRALPLHASRTILSLCGCVCSYHDEQCSLAEFSAYVARDVISHIELAAQARTKSSVKRDLTVGTVVDEPSSDEEMQKKPTVELWDIGGGADEDFQEFEDEVGPDEVALFPLRDCDQALSIALQAGQLQQCRTKARLSQSDRQLKNLDEAYGAMLKQSFSLTDSSVEMGFGFQAHFADAVALQNRSILLAKKQMHGHDDVADDGGDFQPTASGAPQPTEEEEAEAVLVPLPLAMQGPAAVAWHLLQDAGCTEEQQDAIALLALSLQERFDSRPDKTTHKLPLATPKNNHRAVWLGGGGVGKTHTLRKVVEPLAETFFGPDGYNAAAQSNHAAQGLGPRGRTLHASNGLLMTDSLQTARLRLNARTQKKLDRLAGQTGIAVIDELGCVHGSLLHADALRTTYGRSLRYNLDTTKYMQPQQTWGCLPAKILCGDFYQLPPVPASASLLAPGYGQSYEHQQGRKLLADMEYVIDFVEMKRFDDPLLKQVLEAMRVPGGRKISDECWQAIKDTEIKSCPGRGSGASQPACGSGASQPAAWDPRLRAARKWYESAYEWRIVSYAMHAQARLNAHDDGKLLFYIPAVDKAAVRCSREEYDQMRAEPNISKTAKLLGLLPVYVGMEMILAESVLPPKYVRGSACVVLGLELHPNEPPITGRASIASQGCVLLHYLPKAVYVKMQGSKDIHLPTTTQAKADLEGVLAIIPGARSWRFQGPGDASQLAVRAFQVTRSQIPLLPQKQCTLHGVQGTTADPGFIAHWTFPQRLPLVSQWLATYVSLSRPRRFKNLLCHGLPRRELIEGGPPEEIAAALDELFVNKIAATKIACANARKRLKWPARKA